MRAPAIRTNSRIPGLYLHPNLCIAPELAASLLRDIEHSAYFSSGSNQVMLFGRNRQLPDDSISTGLPAFIDRLITQLAPICHSHVPSYVYEILFPTAGCTRSRQVILNRYCPGQGISPHVDLLGRYGDGIIGISLGSGCAMDFARAPSSSNSDIHTSDEVSFWLPENSLLILSGEARYKWTHGIRPSHGDVVANGDDGRPRWIPRGFRTSITIRWLLPGADVVGS